MRVGIIFQRPEAGAAAAQILGAIGALRRRNSLLFKTPLVTYNFRYC
jgi:hypothetical protein